MADVFGKPEAEETLQEQSSPTADEALGHDDEDGLFGGGSEGPEDGQPSPDQPTQPDGEAEDGEAQKLLAGKFRTTEELEKGYNNLQKLLGEQARELGKLRQEAAILDQLRQMGYNIPHPSGPTHGVATGPQAATNLPFGQAAQTPMTAPSSTTSMTWPWYTAKGTPAAPAQPQQQGQQKSDPPEDEDPSEWLDNLYEKGPQVIREMINREARRIAEEVINQQASVLGQGLQQILGPVVQTTAQIQHERMLNQAKSSFDEQVAQLKEQVEDFEEYAPQMIEIVRRNPHILYSTDPQGKPNGIHMAYLVAKATAEQSGTPTVTAKQAARMPSSTGSRIDNKQKDPADIALGFDEEDGKGIWG